MNYGHLDQTRFLSIICHLGSTFFLLRSGLCSYRQRASLLNPTLSVSLSLPLISEEVPVGIIAGGTVGSTILLFIFLLVLVLIFYRQRKGSESFPHELHT